MRQYSRKQICEAIRYWTRKLNEATGTQYSKDKLDELYKEYGKLTFEKRMCNDDDRIFEIDQELTRISNEINDVNNAISHISYPDDATSDSIEDDGIIDQNDEPDIGDFNMKYVPHNSPLKAYAKSGEAPRTMGHAASDYDLAKSPQDGYGSNRRYDSRMNSGRERIKDIRADKLLRNQVKAANKITADATKRFYPDDDEI